MNSCGRRTAARLWSSKFLSGIKHDADLNISSYILLFFCFFLRNVHVWCVWEGARTCWHDFTPPHDPPPTTTTRKKCDWQLPSLFSTNDKEPGTNKKNKMKEEKKHNKKLHMRRNPTGWRIVVKLRIRTILLGLSFFLFGFSNTLGQMPPYK